MCASPNNQQIGLTSGAPRSVGRATQRLGSVITYFFDLENDGNVLLMLADLECEWPGDAGVVAPGESVDCTGDVVVTPDMIVDDAVVNVAVVSAIDPAGESLPDQEPDVTIPVPGGLIIVDPAPAPVPVSDEEPTRC